MAEWQNGHSEPGQADQGRLTQSPASSPASSRASQFPAEGLADQLDRLTGLTRSIAQQHQGQGVELLALLRQLEALHQEIRDGLFQAALPENRQALYALLRDIEANGGWPFIHRMKLQAFLKKLSLSDQEAIDQILENSFARNSHSSSPPAEPESLEW